MKLNNNFWRSTGILHVGDILISECPGHNGDGHFHKYDSIVIKVDGDTIMLQSEHCGIKLTTMTEGRNGYYLKPLI